MKCTLITDLSRDPRQRSTHDARSSCPLTGRQATTRYILLHGRQQQLYICQHTHTLASLHTHTHCVLRPLHTLCNTCMLILHYYYCIVVAGAVHPHRLKDRHRNILSLIHRRTIVILNCSCQYRNKNIKKIINENRKKTS